MFRINFTKYRNVYHKKRVNEETFIQLKLFSRFFQQVLDSHEWIFEIMSKKKMLRKSILCIEHKIVKAKKKK